MTKQLAHLGDSQSRDEARTEARREQRQADTDLRWVLSQPQGRRVYARIVHEMCHVNESSLTGVDVNFREGERNVGLQLVAFAKGVAPELWLTMESEHMAADRAAEEKQS